MELAGLGATITVLARDQAKLDALLGELAGSGHSAHAIDVSNTTALADRMHALADKRPISIIVNNSGGPAPGPAHTAEASSYEAAFRQHLLAYQTVALALVPGMKERGHGRIINIISTSVKQPLHNLGVSNTIRAAVANWAKTLAHELGQHGITVNNVLPGYTLTGRLEEIIVKRAEANSSTREAVEKQFKSSVPMRRFAQPSEVAAAVAFLASPAAGYINGINLPVDGGRTRSL